MSAALAKLPPPPGWPRGWWRATGTLGCCHLPRRGHKTKPGDPIWLSGEPGHVYCARHAAQHGAPEIGS